MCLSISAKAYGKPIASNTDLKSNSGMCDKGLEEQLDC